MDIRFTDIKSDRRNIGKIKKLYKKSFPPSEQAPMILLLYGAGKPYIDLFSCKDGKEWIGFIYVINHLDMSYIFYLAVSENKRGRGFGTAILKKAQELYRGRRLFLAIEEVSEEYDNYHERLRRERFYERAGFLRLGRKIIEADVRYDIMGINGAVDNDEYRSLIRSLLGPVMRFVRFEITEE